MVLVAGERYFLVASLTVRFLGGLAVSHVLRRERGGTGRLIADWAAVARPFWPAAVGSGGEQP